MAIRTSFAVPLFRYPKAPMRNQILRIAPLLALMGPALQAADSVTLKFPTGLPAQLAPLRPGTVMDLEAEVVNPGADETLVWGAWEGSQEEDLADTLLRPLEGGRVRFVAPENWAQMVLLG
jgi:hypothetical protein